MIEKLLHKAKELHQRGDIAQASELYSEVYQQTPDNPELIYFYGIALLQLQDFQKANELFTKLQTRMPGDIDVNYYLALSFQSLDRPGEAIRCYHQVLTINSTHANTLNNLGELYRKQGDYDRAKDCYRKAVLADSAFVEPKFNLLRLFLGIKDLESSTKLVEDLEAHHGDSFFAKLGRALISIEYRQYGVAIEILSDMLSKDESDKTILTPLIIAYRNSGEIAKAIELAAEYRKRKEASADDWLTLANMELCTQRFHEGWVDYLHRFGLRDSVETIADLTPKDLRGKRVLIQKEQGLGDELFFLRFLEYAKSEGARIDYLSKSRLVPLLNDLPLFDKIVSEESGNYDIKLRQADLGHIFSIGEDGRFPRPVELVADAKLVQNTKGELNYEEGDRCIGLTWRAGVKGDNKLFKSIPLDELAQVIRNIDARFFSIQRDPVEGEMERLQQLSGKKIVDCSDFNNDLPRMLALLDILDEYIGVSNTNMHLRASLGKPASVLVPSPPEWRWTSKGKESPWFPNFRLFRQSIDGDWSSAKEELLSHLV
jgi:tetratricopeptide (TPR) repeat protein